MSAAPGLSAISCTSCGAGLDILGGGRVTTHVCGYCGAELDALENYRVLRRFTDLPRPDTPLTIGMAGRIAGVDYRIIGILGQFESDEGRTWVWTDHLIYSPTHGYAWITLEDGHLIFTRRYRKAVQPAWMGSAWVETAKKPPTVSSEGQTFRYYETSVSRITFAEGEFTWRPAVGDPTETVDAMSRDAMLSFSQSGSEREIERSTYLPQPETWASFGVQDPPWRRGVHPLQPYLAKPESGFLFLVGAVAGTLCLVLSAWLWSMDGTQILAPRQVLAASLPVEVPLPIDTTGKLAFVDIRAPIDNRWIWLDIELTDPEDLPVFATGKEISFYSGRDSDGSWTEGSRALRLKFRPETTGTYTLSIEVPETGTGDFDSDGRVPDLTVSARNGASSPFYTLLLAAVFALLALFQKAGPYLHHRARWAKTDWTDDDDDD
jgi:hypothetical protein